MRDSRDVVKHYVKKVRALQTSLTIYRNREYHLLTLHIKLYLIKKFIKPINQFTKMGGLKEYPERIYRWLNIFQLLFSMNHTSISTCRTHISWKQSAKCKQQLAKSLQKLRKISLRNIRVKIIKALLRTWYQLCLILAHIWDSECIIYLVIFIVVLKKLINVNGEQGQDVKKFKMRYCRS